MADPAGLIRTRVHLDPARFAGEANRTRTPGLHLTDVITDIMRTIGIDRSAHNFSEDQLRNFQLGGFIWEDVVVGGVLRGKLQDSNGAAFGIGDYIRLPELAISFNGQDAFWVEPDRMSVPRGYILMSPDGGRLNPFRLLEMKQTTRSVNSEIHPEWWMAGKGYLKGVSVAMGVPVNDVEWHVQYACGDYRGSGPIYEVWNRTFSDQEIEDNWSMLMTQITDRVVADPAHSWAKWVAI